MVSLIIRPNPRIDSKLFLEAVTYCNAHHNKPVHLRIIGVDIDKVELKNGMCHYMRLFIEIRHAHFKCKAYYMRDGALDKTKTEIVNASWETIKMRVKLNQYATHKINGEELYKFETDHMLFYLMNYAFIKLEYVQEGNKQGIKNVKAEDIKNALLNLDVKVVIKEIHGQKMIMPVYEG